ncbi:metal-dependent hydrolase [Salisediminibacterium selenitireducens]|uniref:Membrane-bound metal-dependent hydrolase n=1 Tax=Bacillus selenitireducens (strain ATCC 700615 / DSM 15326 / MLS10) TaxID=439292 RepID=D6XYG6_BACIE|nr:metal-dependent hydrolase [Salisediminibacterium selenitireducens]ADI00235.1 membrane-bound metal-dependent hydrolase [[Bacillus] selenitireducens MLS10]
MDTGTHVVMGFAVGGLATLDPVVGGSPEMTQAVLIGALIGSQAPDFDTVLKLKNNAVYIRNHRGVTHSVPFWFIWAALITIFIDSIIPNVNPFHLFLWTFFAVFLHVFVDIFNAYGTKAFSPFYPKWLALGVINILDPLIFLTHIVAIIMWNMGFDPGYTFLTLYVFLTVYYIWRIRAQRRVYLEMERLHPDATHIFTSPTFKWHQWHIVVRTETEMFVAGAKRGDIQYFETYPFEPIPDDPVINAARKDENLSAFLSFSPAYRWYVSLEPHGYSVKFIDLRYRSKGYYPFVAIVRLNEDLSIRGSYTGWIYNTETLRRKLIMSEQGSS